MLLAKTHLMFLQAFSCRHLTSNWHPQQVCFYIVLLSSPEILKGSLRGEDTDSDGDSGESDRYSRKALFETESLTLDS